MILIFHTFKLFMVYCSNARIWFKVIFMKSKYQLLRPLPQVFVQGVHPDQSEYPPFCELIRSFIELKFTIVTIAQATQNRIGNVSFVGMIAVWDLSLYLCTRSFKLPAVSFLQPFRLRSRIWLSLRCCNVAYECKHMSGERFETKIYLFILQCPWLRNRCCTDNRQWPVARQRTFSYDSIHTRGPWKTVTWIKT